MTKPHDAPLNGSIPVAKRYLHYIRKLIRSQAPGNDADAGPIREHAVAMEAAETLKTYLSKLEEKGNDGEN